MNYLSLFGIIAALTLLVVMMMKGANIYLTAILASLVVAYTSGIGFDPGLTEYYLDGFLRYFKSYFFLFLSGGIFGAMMRVTNAASAVSRLLVSKIPKRWIVAAIPVTCFILCIGGVSVWIAAFAILPIALGIFREMDWPRRFVPAALIVGVATAGQVVPGSPASQNLIPYWGLVELGETSVSPSSGLVVGWFVLTLVLIGCIIWLNVMIKKAQANGEHFVAKPQDTFVDGDEVEHLPNGWVALIPMVVIVILINLRIGGQQVFRAEYAILLSALVCPIIMWKQIKDKKEIFTSIGQACGNTITVISGMCAVIGFGSVAQAAPAFQSMINAVLNMPGPPVLSAFVSTTVICGLAGSASGGLGITVPMLAPSYLALGVPARTLHRVMSIASIGLDSLPHNGAIVGLMNGVCDETHETAYMPIFKLTVVATLAGGLLAVILFTLFPNLP